MVERQYPHIELLYILKDGDADSSSIFTLAGKKYAETRKDAEEVDILVQSREKYTSVKYGRRVLEALSYAEIAHEADEMQADIESRIAQFGAGSLLANSYAGSQLSGPLPDQE